MLSTDINKEIKRENKIFGNFNFRQVLCFGLAAGIEVLFYLIVHPDTNNMVAMGLVLGVIAWYFGFHKKDGCYMEYFLCKTIKLYILRNKSRRYRSKNKYITMMNASYMTDKNSDFADKRKKKIIVKQEKTVAKRKKKTTLKSYK